MKDWICYHNAHDRQCEYKSIGESAFYFGGSSKPNIGDKVWVIEAIGKPNHKEFRLVDCFIISEILIQKDPLPDTKKNNRNTKVYGNKSLMKGKSSVYFNQISGDILEPLLQYVKTAPGFSGAGKRINGLEKLLSLA